MVHCSELSRQATRSDWLFVTASASYVAVPNVDAATPTVLHFMGCLVWCVDHRQEDHQVRARLPGPYAVAEQVQDGQLSPCERLL